MKVVLIHVKENFTPVPPMGIMYIGTLLKEKGHEVHIFDVAPANRKETLARIKSIDPDIIGFSCMTTAYSVTSDFNKRLREIVPHAYYCWGGVHPTARPEQTMEENKLDFLVYGEGELTMVEVCERIKGRKKDPTKRGIDLSGIRGTYYFHSGKIHKNPPMPYIENLDTLPFPDRSMLENFEWYLSPPGILRRKFHYGITTMYTSRGCPYGCIFCCSKIVLGKRIRQRSVANVIAEMAYLKRNFGVTGIYFNDDTFATDEAWIKDFCETLKRSRLNMIWGCQTRANFAQNFGLMKMIVDAGCVQVDIGCESGSDRILNNLGKGITAKMILESFRNLRRLNIDVFATFIIGNPGETMEDLKKTEYLASKAPGSVSFLILVPYPGSPLFDMAVKNKWFTGSADYLVFDERWTNKQSDIPVMAASFKASELVKIRAALDNKFFIKNYSMLVTDFIKNPYFFLKMAMTFIKNPLYMVRSAIKAARKGKITDFLESVYQKFNEELRTRNRDMLTKKIQNLMRPAVGNAARRTK